MPKLSHEALVQLVRNAPELIPGLLRPELRSLATSLIQINAAEFVDLNFSEHRADAVLGLGGTATHPEEIMIVEVQNEPDPRKRRSWPQYVVGPYTRFGCPVVLVVIALDPAVARWCAEPIDVGYGRCVVRPWVIEPDMIPVITDPDQARRFPELAVLSVAAHRDAPGAEYIALAALAATEGLDRDRDTLYPDFVIALLGRVARAALEKLMPANYEYQSDIAIKRFAEGLEKGMEKGLEKGKAVGKADLLLKLLQLKGFSPTDDQRQRVLACTDEALLETWVARVLVARTLDEVFAECR